MKDTNVLLCRLTLQTDRIINPRKSLTPCTKWLFYSGYKLCIELMVKHVGNEEGLVVKVKSVLFSIIIVVLAFLPLTSNAIIVDSSNVVRVDFDLSGETPAPPYDGIYTILGFGASDYLDPGEGFTVTLFDDDGAGLGDGTGYFVVHDIIGSFDLSLAQAAGRFYPGGPAISTGYVDGTISLISAVPDMSGALSDPYTYVNNHDVYVSWVGLDRHILTAVPEPAALLLLSIGLLMIGLIKSKARVC